MVESIFRTRQGIVYQKYHFVNEPCLNSHLKCDFPLKKVFREVSLHDIFSLCNIFYIHILLHYKYTVEKRLYTVYEY